MKVLPFARVIAIATVLLLLVTKGCTYFTVYWFEGWLPQSVEVEEALYIKDSGGFGEGCGVAIYRLEEKTLERIRAHGLAALTGNTQAKRHQDGQYSEWNETPYVEPEGALQTRWLSGLAEGCSDIPSDMRRAIYLAMKSSGSFYATAHESGVIIFPGLGWIMFSHFG